MKVWILFDWHEHYPTVLGVFSSLDAAQEAVPVVWMEPDKNGIIYSSNYCYHISKHEVKT